MQEFIQKELLYAFETSYNKTRLHDMAERYAFLDKIDLFSSIIEDTLYGKIPVASLSTILKDRLGVSEEVAQYINIEIDRELFSEVRHEFNVAQGLTTVEQYEKELQGYAKEKGYSGPEEEVTPVVPKKPEPSPKLPVETSAEPEPSPAPETSAAPSEVRNIRPGEKPSDPYREPVE